MKSPIAAVLLLTATLVAPTAAFSQGGADSAVMRNQSRIINESVNRQTQQALKRQKAWSDVKTVVTRSLTNLRAQPSLNAPIAFRVPGGTTLSATAAPDAGDWYAVSHQGQTVYVYARAVNAR